MGFNKIQEIIKIADERDVPFWQVVLEDDLQERNVSYEESFGRMQRLFDAMVQADKNYSADLRSHSGLSGGDGAKLEKFRRQDNRLIGDFLTMVMEKAVKMAESNACMKRIVAAPTAGSCGVIPAVLLTYYEKKAPAVEKVVQALYVAAGIGQVIANTASISGAEGGCQAEIGSASSMAAGALIFLEGGTNEQIADAAALAMKNMLGLTCDPVAGLVEVPCIKRNVSGAVNAIIASQMVMAGIKSAITADEVFETMGRIGNLLPQCLRETSQDGLASTTTAQKVVERLSSI
ncbi:L-serine dehydratase [Treponema bryantii]|uniref:L-serine dehydratase n=1 Tax=Treponema bryantii TaxID=163 RepID=A0A1H9CWN2_9SPIR|nr:L-serine ammonia-lyase, iron-sulfur-dependent, subunit alpha [Treponema bryantii]MBP5443971.1 L-serine ammonia-lyase, iron-sulfur-dependent, subunit alpha [Treponema sp.]MBP5794306.1 L-serine ammonia-lyase, iron-sulfur-dependent, subunit alpha [Spirochaetaceae bacterium]SEQ04968.1 L-serine dehydratase [Treponema bryantii]